MGESHAFRNMEEMDFFYVFDMLVALGIHAPNEDDLLDNCYLLQCPLGVYSGVDGQRLKLVCAKWALHLEPAAAEGLAQRGTSDITGRVASVGFNYVRLT
ncbi:hypothetical protein Zm00014a_027830 [Zea mays]|uniref:Uncharacterized protein n=2 Tax=Zea mays TaxID=4577 RepID=A0A8J8XDH7_MAIZE|nr:Cellulase (glycosyl hydrolase family 5) protein [Zea mays]PWZ26396.1 hypothetical protein Zm00014a_027830 [Zea mays]